MFSKLTNCFLDATGTPPSRKTAHAVCETLQSPSIRRKLPQLELRHRVDIVARSAPNDRTK